MTVRLGLENLGALALPTLQALVARPVGAPRGAILLVHGFALPAAHYSALASLLASRGYAVVAPDVYAATDRAGAAPERRSVAGWAARATAAFPTAPLVLAGHSRGGQACALALIAALGGEDATHWMPEVAALVLLDVVEGAPGLCGLGGLRPRLLARVDGWPRGLVEVPVLVVGARLGTLGPFAAAPAGHNFDSVWEGLARFAAARGDGGRTAMFLVVADDFGHIDYLNDRRECQGLVSKVSNCVVRGGAAPRAVFRSFVATCVAEFLDAYLGRGEDARGAWLRRVASLRDARGFVELECGNTVRAKADDLSH
jgi:Chlorophyllase enzyme